MNVTEVTSRFTWSYFRLFFPEFFLLPDQTALCSISGLLLWIHRFFKEWCGILIGHYICSWFEWSAVHQVRSVLIERNVFVLCVWHWNNFWLWCYELIFFSMEIRNILCCNLFNIMISPFALVERNQRRGKILKQPGARFFNNEEYEVR